MNSDFESDEIDAALIAACLPNDCDVMAEQNLSRISALPIPSPILILSQKQLYKSNIGTMAATSPTISDLNQQSENLKLVSNSCLSFESNTPCTVVTADSATSKHLKLLGTEPSTCVDLSFSVDQLHDTLNALTVDFTSPVPLPHPRYSNCFYIDCYYAFNPYCLNQ